jgi:hypothetical protein
MIPFRRTSVPGHVPQVSALTTVTAYLITNTFSTNRIEAVTGRLVNHDDGSFVVGQDRTVRIARGHAYLTRAGALLGLRELITLALPKRIRRTRNFPALAVRL